MYTIVLLEEQLESPWNEVNVTANTSKVRLLSVFCVQKSQVSFLVVETKERLGQVYHNLSTVFVTLCFFNL